MIANSRSAAPRRGIGGPRKVSSCRAPRIKMGLATPSSRRRGKIACQWRAGDNKPMTPLDLTGRVALVTGASSGIGRAAAIRLAREGAKGALVGRRAERVQEVADACV